MSDKKKEKFDVNKLAELILWLSDMAHLGWPEHSMKLASDFYDEGRISSSEFDIIVAVINAAVNRKGLRK